MESSSNTNKVIDPNTGLETTQEEFDRAERQWEQEYEQQSRAAAAQKKKKKKKKDSGFKPGFTNRPLASEQRTELDRKIVNPKTGRFYTDAEVNNPALINRSVNAPSPYSTENYHHIKLDDYTPYMDAVRPGKGLDALNQERAENQSNWDQAGNAVVRTVANATLDFVGGMASMLDLEDYANQDSEIGNEITRATEKAKEGVNEEFAIYRENPNEAFDFGDAAWWFENGSSLMSSVGSFLAQGAVLSATLGAGAGLVAANLAKVGGKASFINKLVQGGVRGVTAGMLNQSESIMSAMPVFTANYQHYMNMGVSEEQAKARAASDASDVIKINRANILLNLTSASMFMRAGAQKIGGAVATEVATEAPTKFFSKKGLGKLLSEGGQEFAEEQINYISEKEGSRAITGSNNNNILSAIGDGSQMSKYAKDAHFWESGVLGAVGGMAQFTGQHANYVRKGGYEKDLQKYTQTQDQIANLQKLDPSGQAIFLKTEELGKFAEKVRILNDELEVAEQEKDVKKINKLRTDIEEVSKIHLGFQTLQSFQSGTTPQLKEAYKRFANLTDEEVATKQLPADARERAQKALDFIENAEQAYNDNAFVAPKTRMQLVENRANAFHVKGALQEFQTEISTKSSELAEAKALLPQSDQGLEDTTLADKYPHIKKILADKAVLEKNFDKIAKSNTDLDSKFNELLQDGYSKKQRNKIQEREGEAPRRVIDDFKETLLDRLNDAADPMNQALEPDPISGMKPVYRPRMQLLQEIEQDILNSNSPNKENYLKAIDELKAEEELGADRRLAQKVKDANAEILRHIKSLSDNPVEDVQEEFGVSQSEAKDLLKTVPTEEQSTGVDVPMPGQGSITDILNQEKPVEGPSPMEPGMQEPVEKPVEDTSDLPAELAIENAQALFEVLLDEPLTEETAELISKNLAMRSNAFSPEQRKTLQKRLIEIVKATKGLDSEKTNEENELNAFVNSGTAKTIDTSETLEKKYDEDGNPIVDEFDIEEDLDAPGTSILPKGKQTNSQNPSTIDTQFVVHSIPNPQYAAGKPITRNLNQHKGYYVPVLDRSGNLLEQPATSYEKHTDAKLKQLLAKGDITQEQYDSRIPLYWHPIQIGSTGKPVIDSKKKYVTNKTQVPLRTNGAVGQPLFMINMVPEGVVLQSEVLDFKLWNQPMVGSEADATGAIVYLKKDEYVYPKNHPLAGQDLYPTNDPTDEVITVHLTPDGPPVQKLASGEYDIRMNWDSLQKDGIVKMKIKQRDNGTVNNVKDVNGKSVENPITALGEMGVDFFVGVRRGDNIDYINEFGNEASEPVKETSQQSDDSGKIFAIKYAPNGKKIAIRLNTQNVREEDAEKLVDKLISSGDVKVDGRVASEVQELVAQPQKDGAWQKPLNERADYQEGWKFPAFLVDALGRVKFKAGTGKDTRVFAVESRTNDYGYNNLQNMVNRVEENDNGDVLAIPLLIFDAENKNFGGGNGTRVQISFGSEEIGENKIEVIDGPELSQSVLDDLYNLRETLIRNVQERKYQVSFNSIQSNGTQYLLFDKNQQAKPYTQYLSDNKILTTDVSETQAFRQSNATLEPTNVVLNVVPDAQVPTTTDVSETNPATDKQVERIFSLNMVIGSYQDDVIPEAKKERKNLISQKKLTSNPDLVSNLETKIKEYDEAIKSYEKSLAEAKKELATLETPAAAIEKRRQNNLEDTGDIFDYVSKQPNKDGQFNAFYTTTKETQTFDTYQQAVDWINSKYDEELNALETKTSTLQPNEPNPVSEIDLNQIIPNEVNTNPVTTTPNKVTEEGLGEISEDADIPDFRKMEEAFDANPLSILTDTELQWIIDTFGESHLLPMAQAKFITIKGVKAYGAYSNGMIKLASQGARGTGYHEGFHLVYDLATTEDEKQALQEDAKKIYAEPTTTDIENLSALYPNLTIEGVFAKYYEEEMAEGFRKFMEEEESKGRLKKTPIGKAMQKFFDRLRRILLSLRIKGTSLLNPDAQHLSALSMRKMFLSAKHGYNTERISQAEKKSFNEQEVDLRRKPGFSETYKLELLNGLRYALLTRTFPEFQANGKTTASTLEAFLTEPEYKQDFEEALSTTRSKLLDFASKLQANKDKGIADRGTLMLSALSETEWENQYLQGNVVSSPGFKNLLLQSLTLHGVKVNLSSQMDALIASELEEMTLEPSESGDATKDGRIHDVDAIHVNPKKSLTFNVKTAMSFIIQPEIVDPVSKVVLQSGKGDSTLLPVFVDVHKAYAIIKSKLADVSPKDMEAKMERISAFNPTVAAVYQAYKSWNRETQIQFQSAMAGTQLQFVTIINGSKGAELINTNRQGVEFMIIEEWKNARNDKKLFTILDDLEVVDATVGKLVGSKYAAHKSLDLKTITPLDYFNSVADISSYFGMTIDPDIMSFLLNSYSPEQFEKQFVDKHLKQLVTAIGYNPSTKKFTENKESFYYGNQSKRLQDMAKFFTEVREDLFTGSFTNGQGKLIYSLNLNSYLSKFVSGVKDATRLQEIQKEFFQDVFYKPSEAESTQSLFLSLMGNEDVRRNFKVAMIDTLKEEHGEEGKIYTEMDGKTADMTKLSMWNNGGNRNTTGYAYFNVGTPADKSRSSYYYLPILNGSEKIDALYEYAKGQEDTHLARVRQAAKKALLRNIIQEHARIKKTQQELIDLPDSLLKENLHYKMGKDANGNEIKDRSKANGLRFYSVPDLNFSDYNLFDKNGKVVESLSEVTSEIDEALEAFLEREIMLSKKSMEKNGTIFEYNGKYYSTEFNKKTIGIQEETILGKKVVAMDAVLDEFLTNDLVWRTEMVKFSMGDLALYKTAGTDISSNPIFEGKKGMWYSVVKDASKRAYQSITPGLDHIVDWSNQGYGKPINTSMAVLEDITAYTSINSAMETAYALADVKENWSPRKIYTLEKEAKELTKKENKTKEDTSRLKEIQTEIDGLFATDGQRKAYDVAMAYHRTGANKADAQGYTSIDAHRESMMSTGTWTTIGEHSHEAAFPYWKNEPNYEKWPEFAKKLAIKPLKTFTFGYQYNPITKSVEWIQIKHSTVPLYPAFTKSNAELDKLRRRMELSGEYANKGLQKIDVVNFESAVKVGKQGTNKYTQDGAYLSNMVIQQVKSANELSPFILPTDEGANPKDGSQLLHMIMANLPLDGMYDTIPGVEALESKDVRNIMHSTYTEKIKRSFDKLQKDLGIAEYQTALQEGKDVREAQLKFLMKMQKMLLQQIEARELPENYSLALEIMELSAGGKYSFAMPLSFPPFAKKFEIAMASLYKSRVMTQRLPGDAAVQVAEFGLDEANDLKYYGFDSKGNMLPAECAISYKEIIKLGLDKYVGKNGRINTAQMEKDGLDLDILNIVGYRIPTQGKNSMLPLRVVKVLPPSAKGQIMLPAQITLQTGADYDVDKLFLYYPDLQKDKKTGLVKKTDVSKHIESIKNGTQNWADISDNAIQNILFDLRYGILTSVNNNAEVITPLDNDLLSSKVKEYEKIEGMIENVGTYNFASYHTQSYIEQINKDAKVLVGIYASHNRGMSIAQQVPLVFNNELSEGVRIMYNNIDSHIDIQGATGIALDGTMRTSALDALLNGALDNAKDPITGSLNINIFTSNVVALLARTGIPLGIAIDFVNQPIIRELTREFQISGEFVPDAVAKELVKKYSLPTKLNKEKIAIDSASRVTITPELLTSMLGKNMDSLNADEKVNQMQILQDFLAYYQGGRDLAKVNKALSPDRFATMSGLSDIEIWDNNKNYVIDEEGRSTILMPNVYTGNTDTSAYPMAQAYYEYAIKGAEALISQFLPYNKSALKEVKASLAQMLGHNNGFTDASVINAVNSGLYSLLMMDSHSPIRLYMDSLTSEDLQRLLYDKDKSLVKRFTQLAKKYDLKNHIVFKHFKPNSQNNKRKLQSLDFKNGSDIAGTTLESITDALEEMLTTPEKVIKNIRLANGKVRALSNELLPNSTMTEKEKAVDSLRKVTQELMVYGMVSSGFQDTVSSFLKLYPMSFWKNMFMNQNGEAVASMSLYMRQVEDSLSATTSDILNRLNSNAYLEQLIRNMYKTKKLVKVLQEPVVGTKPNANSGIQASRGVEKFANGKLSGVFNAQFKVLPTLHSKIYNEQTGFPMYLKMYDSANKTWRLYKKSETKDGEATVFEVIPSLGAGTQFFEFYPTETNPKSISPEIGEISLSVRMTGKPISSIVQKEAPLFEDEAAKEPEAPQDAKLPDSEIDAKENPFVSVTKKRQVQVEEAVNPEPINIDEALGEISPEPNENITVKKVRSLQATVKKAIDDNEATGNCKL